MSTEVGKYRGIGIPAGLASRPAQFRAWREGIDAAKTMGTGSAQDFTSENPFEEPSFIDRLADGVSAMEYESHGCVSGSGTFRTLVREVLGDRDELAGKIQEVIDRECPFNDLEETGKGIYFALEYLFGPEAS